MVQRSGSEKPAMMIRSGSGVTVQIGLTDEQLEAMFNRAVPALLGGMFRTLRRSGVEPSSVAFHLASYAILVSSMGRPAFRKAYGIPERTERRWFRMVQVGLAAAEDGEVSEAVDDFFGMVRGQ